MKLALVFLPLLLQTYANILPQEMGLTASSEAEMDFESNSLPIPTQMSEGDIQTLMVIVDLNLHYMKAALHPLYGNGTVDLGRYFAAKSTVGHTLEQLGDLLEVTLEKKRVRESIDSIVHEMQCMGEALLCSTDAKCKSTASRLAKCILFTLKLFLQEARSLNRDTFAFVLNLKAQFTNGSFVQGSQRGLQSRLAGLRQRLRDLVGVSTEKWKYVDKVEDTKRMISSISEQLARAEGELVLGGKPGILNSGV